jgi:hypothetical protein
MITLIQYIPYALVAILVGLAFGTTVRAVVEHQEDRPSKPYRAFLFLWEGMKRPLRRFEGRSDR